MDTDYKNENMFLMMFALFKILYIGIKLTINFKIHYLLKEKKMKQ